MPWPQGRNTPKITNSTERSGDSTKKSTNTTTKKVAPTKKNEVNKVPQRGRPPLSSSEKNNKSNARSASLSRRTRSSSKARSVSANNRRIESVDAAPPANYKVRLTVLGLAGIVVNNETGEKSGSSSLATPERYRAIVAVSRDEVVKGTSAASLPLTKSPGSLSEDGRYLAVWSNPSGGGGTFNGSGPMEFSTTLHRAARPEPHDSTGGVLHHKINGSSSSANTNNNDDDGRSTATSSAYAPKSFEVTVALARDDHPTARPLGVSTLVVTGEECLKASGGGGMAAVLDLPVLGLDQVTVNGGAPRPWMPVISSSGHPLPPLPSQTETKEPLKPKKKKRLPRFFGGKNKNASKTMDSSEGSGGKASLRPTSPNSLVGSDTEAMDDDEEGFSKIYGIDPTDAVLRVSLEVFEVGSDLEKIFDGVNRSTVGSGSPSAKEGSGAQTLETPKSKTSDKSSIQNIRNSRSRALVDHAESDEEESLLDDDGETTNTDGREDGTYRTDGTRESEFTYVTSTTAASTHVPVSSGAKKRNASHVLDALFGGCGQYGIKQREACAVLIDGLDDNTQVLDYRYESSASYEDHTTDVSSGEHDGNTTLDSSSENGGGASTSKSVREASRKALAQIKSSIAAMPHAKTQLQAEASGKKTSSNSSPRSVQGLQGLQVQPSESLSMTDQEGSLESASIRSDAKSGQRQSTTSSVSFFQRALQCHAPRIDDDEELRLDVVDASEEEEDEEDDDDEGRNYRRPPQMIDEMDDDDVTELTFETMDDDEPKKVTQTTDLVAKVTPRVTLAAEGKALAGRVLLPAAFGGDGLCIHQGRNTRLVVRGEKTNEANSGGPSSPNSNRPPEDYERLFFRQSKELDPVVANRAMRTRADHDSDIVKDDPITGIRSSEAKSEMSADATSNSMLEEEDGSHQYGNSKSKVVYDGPVSAVYSADDGRGRRGVDKSEVSRYTSIPGVQQTDTTDTEDYVASTMDDKYKLYPSNPAVVSPPTSPRKGILKNHPFAGPDK